MSANNRQPAAKLKNLTKIYSKGEDLLPSFGLLTVCLLLYSRVVGLFFYSDDFHHLLVNQNIRWWDAFSYQVQASSNLNLYRPTTNFYYLINEKLFGINPLPYFSELLFIVALTSIFLYHALYLLTEKKLPSFVGTLIFTVLPSHVDPVAWPANICDTLLGFFAGLSLLLTASYIKTDKKYYLPGVLGAASLALLSKEPAIGLAFPLGLLILLCKKGIRQKFMSLFALSVPFILYVLSRLYYSEYIKTLDVTPGYKMPVPAKLSQYNDIFFEVLSRLFMMPQTWVRADVLFWTKLILLSLLLLTVLSGRYWKIYLIGYVMMVFLVLPTITVEYIFDRYVYASSLGLALMAAAVMSGFPNKYARVPLYGLIIAALMGISLVTFNRLSAVKVASDHSRNFVKGLTNVYGPAEIDLVPYSYRKNIFHLWNINQMIVSEKSHPTSIRRVFYHSSAPLNVRSTATLVEPDYNVSLEHGVVKASGAIFNIEHIQILMAQHKLRYYYNGNTVRAY